MPGIFIALEGLDGAGKTTQGKLLKQWFEELGYSVILTREPGGCKISEDIREILLSNDNTEMAAITESYLYASARAQLVAQVIKPALEAGNVVICDRFIYSSIAYQGYARGLTKEKVLEINKNAIGDVWPNLTVFFDIPLEVCRVSENKDRMENSGDEFFNAVAFGYKDSYGDKDSFVVNAKDTISNISEKIIDEIKSRFNIEENH